MPCLTRAMARARPAKPPPIMAMGWVGWLVKDEIGSMEEECEVVGEIWGLVESLIVRFELR